MGKYCPGCGKMVKALDKYCKACNHVLHKIAEPPKPPYEYLAEAAGTWAKETRAICGVTVVMLVLMLLYVAV